jgi:hypothetical protein
MRSEDIQWQRAKLKAFGENNWFTSEFINLAIENLCTHLLQHDILNEWAKQFQLADHTDPIKKIGVVMSGNIPLAGFQDIVAIFLAGHHVVIKPSSKDEALIKELIRFLHNTEASSIPYFTLPVLLKNCDAYIATSANNSGAFEQYLNKYPSLIRRTQTSVAILDGTETNEELELLSDDIHQYFGLGESSVRKLFVPKEYDFVPLLGTFNKYEHLRNHNRYKNNYDYQLSAQILKNNYYMTNGSTLMVEHTSVFPPISQVNYEYYHAVDSIIDELKQDPYVFNVVSHKTIPFGTGQTMLITSKNGIEQSMNFLRTVR